MEIYLKCNNVVRWIRNLLLINEVTLFLFIASWDKGAYYFLTKANDKLIICIYFNLREENRKSIIRIFIAELLCVLQALTKVSTIMLVSRCVLFPFCALIFSRRNFLSVVKLLNYEWMFIFRVIFSWNEIHRPHEL